MIVQKLIPTVGLQDITAESLGMSKGIPSKKDSDTLRRYFRVVVSIQIPTQFSPIGILNFIPLDLSKYKREYKTLINTTI